nr:hypothetical protein [Mycolicibacterium llatzerense]
MPHHDSGGRTAVSSLPNALFVGRSNGYWSDGILPKQTHNTAIEAEQGGHRRDALA